MAKRARKKNLKPTSTVVSTVPLANPSLPTPGRCHFLDLPPELRLHVYDLVADFEISQPVFDHYIVTGCSLQWRRQTPVRLPVANLAMTCGLIAKEVRRHTLPESQRYAIISLRIPADPFEMSHRTYFQRAPCLIVELTALTLKLDIKLGKSTQYGFDSSPEAVRDRLGFLSQPSSSFSHARADLEVQIHVHVRREESNGQSKQSYELTIDRIRTAWENKMNSPSIRKINIKKFTSDPWVNRPATL